jgi:hypothetical protein
MAVPVCWCLGSLPAFAQGTTGAAAIAGVVKDASGGVLPGVTVEAASPALIEKVRSVVTDPQGEYKIVDLRPGLYSVTFTLPGFSTTKREGVELTPNLTASVNVELRVGEMQETVTVSGASPVIDVQNVTQASTLSRGLLDVVPSNKSMLSFAALVPAVILPQTAQDVGGSKGELSVRMLIHGGHSGDAKLGMDGMNYNSAEGTGRGIFINPASSEEVSVEGVAGGSAEYDTGGSHVNIVPKDGADQFSAYFFTNYSDHGLQSNNLTPSLQSQGLKSVNGVHDVYDVNGAVGGPIVQSRLWFFTAHRHWGYSAYVANLYHNATQGTARFTPDLGAPALQTEYNQSDNVRLTWQASSKDKITLLADIQNNCACQSNLTLGGNAWEATMHYLFLPSDLFQATWTRAATNKLLFEAGFTGLYFHIQQQRQPGVGTNDISIFDQGAGFRWNAPALQYGFGTTVSSQWNARFATSYVTGSHNFKAGLTIRQAFRQPIENNYNDNLTYTFTNGVPTSLTEWSAYSLNERLKADLGVFVQDQWTIRRLTLNLGLRFDYLNSYDLATFQPATQFLPARSFPEADCLPCWEDVNPRLGASYDLFGNGKTALKASVSRYVAGETVGTADTYNPANNAVNNVTRAWTDSNHNFVPDCDLNNPLQNGECGQINNLAFGQPITTTHVDPAVLNGWGNRGYNWQVTAMLQRELKSGVAASVGYYRTWFSNQLVTDNLSVKPTNYDPYCITSPIDPGLPGGGGQQICGLYDLTPSLFGQVNNLVTFARNFGVASEVYNGVDFNFNARLPHGAILNGGVSIGNEMTTGVSHVTNCFVVNSPQQLRNCDLVTPYQARLKVFGSYPMPWDFQASANFQSLPGPVLLASYVASNAQIAPSLGRNLSGGARTAPAIDLMTPWTQFEPRVNQLDVRLTRIVKIGRTRVQGMFDVYNLLNASPVLALNTTYGANWQVPQQILDGRLFKFGVQFEF